MLYWVLLDLITTKKMNKEYMMNVVKGTLALEGIELSEQSIENLDQYASGEKSFDELLSEIKEKYNHNENKSRGNKTTSINNSVASARMEGLDPTPEDIELIKQFVEHKITKDEFIEIILKQVKEESNDESI